LYSHAVKISLLRFIVYKSLQLTVIPLVEAQPNRNNLSDIIENSYMINPQTPCHIKSYFPKFRSYCFSHAAQL